MKIEDSVLLGDTLQVDENGYLRVNARTARTGIQVYSGFEVGRPDMKAVNVYRDEAEVFSKSSLDTFANIPITVGHPEAAVNAQTWRDKAVGNTLEEVLRDGEYLKIGLKIMDASAVQAVKDGTRELSVGYETQLLWEDGKAPDGTPYQAKQTGIVANHIAIVPRGRAGSKARIGDAGAKSWGAAPIITTDKETVTMTDALRTVVVDGLSVQTTDQGAQAITKLQKDLESSAAKLAAADAAHSAAIAAKDEEIGTLKADLKKAQDAIPSPEALSKLVADRAALEATVKAIAKDVKTEGVSDADIRKAAVAAKLGDDMVKDASEAEIAGMFKAIAKDAATSDPVRAALLNRDTKTNVTDNGQAAYEKRLADAWKQKGA